MALGILSCSGDATDTADATVTDAAERPADAGATLAPPVELSPSLCEDMSALSKVVDALSSQDAEGPSYGEPRPEQLQRMLQNPTRGPFYMVNLIKFRDRAEYPDGRATELTGREANDLYAPTEFLDAIGARVAFVGDVSGSTFGAEGDWDQVAIVEYPCPLALLAMSAHPEFEARSVHKDSGLAASIVMVTYLRAPDAVEVAEPTFPSTPEDRAFELVQVIRHRASADYGANSNEPARTGAEAMAAYTATAAPARAALGIRPTARLEVEGVFIGDDRDWDEVWIDLVPSQATLEALEADPAVATVRHHREAALEEGYGLKVSALLSDFPGGGGNPGLPTTGDGTGTPCTSDADCAGLTASLCLAQTFCTVEGCTRGSCEGIYVCCHDCNPAAAGVLPFEGSACIPGPGTDQLQSAAGCTCD